MKKFLASVLVLTSLSCFGVMSSYATNELMCYSNSSDVCNLRNDAIAKLDANTIDNNYYPADDNSKCYDHFFDQLVNYKIPFMANICGIIFGIGTILGNIVFTYWPFPKY